MRSNIVLTQVLLVAFVAVLLVPFILIRLREKYTVAQLNTPQTRILQIHGNAVAVRDYGQGDVVMLIHGFAGWSDTWEEVVTRLVTRQKRVIAVDLIGAGASARSDNSSDYATDAQARLLLSVMHQLGIENATLIGHSYGGRVAMQTAILDSAKVHKIIAIAPEAFATDRPPMAKLVGLPLFGYALAYWSTAPALIGIGLRSVSRRKAWVTAAEVERYAMPVRVLGHLQGQIVQSVSPKDGDMPVPRHFARITCPVYVIWGDSDPVFPATDGLKLVDQLPDAHLAIVPQCGHLPHVEAAEETWQLIDQAL